MNIRKARTLMDHVAPQHTRLASVHLPPTQKPDQVNWQQFAAQYEFCQLQMTEKHLWFEDALNYNFRPAMHKKIALGRTQFYLQFVDFYFKRYGQRLYLLDLLLRKDGLDGQQSLLYFIEDAEEIHVNLEGVLPSELKYATIGLGRLAADKNEVRAPYTATWEINQIVYKDLLNITTFHTGSSMSRKSAFRAMGGLVPMERILDDNRFLLDDWTVEVNQKQNEELEEL